MAHHTEEDERRALRHLEAELAEWQEEGAEDTDQIGQVDHLELIDLKIACEALRAKVRPT